MDKLVSILIPAFNAQDWITATIRSALSQTWPNKEIIVVDDGSNDKTFDIVQKFNSPKIKLYSQDNSGACRARNEALRYSEGDYIQWLDADDILAPDKIEKQMEFAGKLGDQNVLFTSEWGKFYYRINKTKFVPSNLWMDLDSVEWLVQRLSNTNMMPNSAWLVSRKLTEKGGKWDERLIKNQDGEYFCRLVAQSQSVKFVSGSRCYYRIANPKSISIGRSRKSWESLVLSVLLEIKHLLSREYSERTITASFIRLNNISLLLGPIEPEMSEQIKQFITELGGDVKVKNSFYKNILPQKIFTPKLYSIFKEVKSKAYRRIFAEIDSMIDNLFKSI